MLASKLAGIRPELPDSPRSRAASLQSGETLLFASVASVRLSKGDRLRRRLPGFRPEIYVEGTMTRVLVEQMGAVDMTRPGNLVGHLTPEAGWGVDSAILTVLGLN
jgi:hypothetical protein